MGRTNTCAKSDKVPRGEPPKRERGDGKQLEQAFSEGRRSEALDLRLASDGGREGGSQALARVCFDDLWLSIDLAHHARVGGNGHVESVTFGWGSLCHRGPPAALAARQIAVANRTSASCWHRPPVEGWLIAFLAARGVGSPAVSLAGSRGLSSGRRCVAVTIRTQLCSPPCGGERWHPARSVAAGSGDGGRSRVPTSAAAPGLCPYGLTRNRRGIPASSRG